MKIADHSEFWVIGIEARTSNAQEMAPGGAIPKIWRRFMAEALAEKIPNRIGQSLYAVYTEYAGDEHGDYTFVVGVKVAEGTTPPDGMILRQVPSGAYWSLATERGPVWQVVPQAWKQVWQESAARTFRTDFEIYDDRAANPELAIVELCIGVVR